MECTVPVLHTEAAVPLKLKILATLKNLHKF